MDKKEKEILAIIRQIRLSFSDAKIVYLFGACYGLYEILKLLYPKAEAYMVDNNHVITKIGDVYYDITGIYILGSDEIMIRMCDDIQACELGLLNLIVREK